MISIRRADITEKLKEAKLYFAFDQIKGVLYLVFDGYKKIPELEKALLGSADRRNKTDDGKFFLAWTYPTGPGAINDSTADDVLQWMKTENQLLKLIILKQDNFKYNEVFAKIIRKK